MNEKQNKAIDVAVKGHNLLLLGAAGTGKSFVVKEIEKRLCGQGKNVQITCSTEIACQVYKNAVTIHKFAGLLDGRYGPDEISNVIQNNRIYDEVLKNIKRIDTLIVDEVSMISQKIFDTINEVCCLKDPTQEFGGVQVIFVGDFYQLPPVANKYYNDDGSYCFQSAVFETVFQHRVVLTDNIRQNEVSLITTVRETYEGSLSADSDAFLRRLNRPLDVTSNKKLFARNDLVDDYNRKSLMKHPGIVHAFESTDSGAPSDLTSITAPRILWLKKGVPVVLLRNLTDVLVNGLCGTVYDFDENGPVVHFPSINITKRISKVKFTVFSPRLNKDIAVREQYPLKLGFGLTIHKAQGMTLSSVEVDCREIFRPGQLGVAISRATSSNGLRILNFHPRYVIPPPQTVVDFMKGPSKPILPDLDCCQHLKSPSGPNTPQYTSQTVQLTPVQSISHDDDMGFEETDEENLDDDFNKIIECIAKGEAEAVDFEIPAQFNIDKVLKDASFEKEVTESHTKINAIINRLDPQKLSIFIKKLFLKVGEFVNKLITTKASGQGIPEKHLVQYIQLVHKFSNSTEYKLSCLILFETEDKCLENHMIVCDCILEAVRGHYLKEKVVLMSTTGGQLPKRDITNASRARIRYVAGYCLASVRKKYSKIKSSNIYAQTTVAQQSYEEAKGILGILNKVKEEESFLQQTSTEKNSLLDVERRQFASKGLTNVTDSFYFFYISLTDKLLKELPK